MSDTFTICFRLPVRFRAPLTKLAKAAHGSINQQAVAAIELYVAIEQRRAKNRAEFYATQEAPKRAKGKR